MKYSELSDRQAEALRSFYLSIVSSKSQEAFNYAKSGLQLLLVGNGAGVLVTLNLIGNLAQAGKLQTIFLLPLVLFLLGVLSAALMFLPLSAVSDQTSRHLGESMERFFRDQKHIEELQPYGFSKRGRIVVILLFLGSVLGFLSATITGVIGLGRLS